jgi:hypothetical protein
VRELETPIAMQKLAVGHETLLMPAFGSMDWGADQLVPL